MSLYARSDLMSVAVPQTSGGCGKQHIRPVVKGAPVKTWQLDCDRCERYLRGDGRPKILHTTPGDPSRGIPQKQKRVADADPMWSTTPYNIPKTPDEEEKGRMIEEEAQRQKEALNLISLAANAGVKLPPLLQQQFDELIGNTAIQGSVLCLNGHDNAAGTKFCTECGVSMTAKAVIEPEPAGVPYEIDLYKLDHRTLQKMCKEKGINAKGSKEELIKRLT